MLQKTLHASTIEILMISPGSKPTRLFRKCNPGVGWFSLELPRMPSKLKIKDILHNLIQPLTKREKTILKFRSNGDTCHHIQKFNYHSNPND